jgi:hypothetical protein
MVTFTINDENNIAVYAAAEEAAQAGDSTAISFDSQSALATVSGGWPVQRLVEIWNGIPGNQLVTKFQDRKRAVARIWQAIQRLRGEPSDVEPVKGKGSSKSGKTGKKAKTAKKGKGVEKASNSERANKKAEVIAMMKRAKGAMLAEIMEATGWQAHTVRGFVSILGSKGGEKAESLKNSAGERTYRIAR